ncbi:alpha/beta hydrolase [Paenibacillus sp. F4]|uniref:alpha/beta hydrolase n=1 Tax=Paenibacillus sp. F4 TaxID=357385 RepID=UPI000C9F7486|nr:alpha/beta hydrolase [Paenibacillus sp. F4]PNQ82675.1 alpha/beta hydrolase [Paenibacillus sp. F4]
MSIEFSRWPNNYMMSYQVTKALGMASLGATDVTEIYEACKKIDPDDKDTWHREWLITAQALERHGKEAETAGNWYTARNCYIRACNYYRIAEYAVMDDDTEKIRIFKKVNELFEAAGKYFDVQPEKIQVDYEDVKLDGYFFSPSWIKGPKPTLFALNGGDEWSIENYFWLGPAFISCGYNFLVYDQPGTGLSLYEKGKGRRADSEAFHSRAIDFLLTRPEVDPDKIIVHGESFAAYDSLRFASFDHRIAAVISDGGTHAFDWDAMLKWMPPSLAAHGMRILGAKSLEDFAGNPRFAYDLEGVLHQIECPLLVMHGAEEILVQPNPLTQALKNYEQAGSKNKTFYPIEDRRLGGLEHCQVDNINVLHEVVLNWLCSIGLGPASPRLSDCQDIIK